MKTPKIARNAYEQYKKDKTSNIYRRSNVDMQTKQHDEDKGDIMEIKDFDGIASEYARAADVQLEHVGGVEGLQAIVNGESPKKEAPPSIPENAIFGMIPPDEAKAIAERLNAVRPEGVDPVTVEEVIGKYMKSMLSQAGLSFYGAAIFKKKTLSVFENSGNYYTLERDRDYICLRRITTKNVKIVRAATPEPAVLEPVVSEEPNAAAD